MLTSPSTTLYTGSIEGQPVEWATPLLSSYAAGGRGANSVGVEWGGRGVVGHEGKLKWAPPIIGVLAH